MLFVILVDEGKWHSLLHSECHFFFLKSQSIIEFSRFLLPRSVEKRQMRLRLELENDTHSNHNWLYLCLAAPLRFKQLVSQHIQP